VVDYIEAHQTAESLEAVVAVDVSELQRARGDLLGIMNRTLGIGPL
jgi:hypothetical protein